MKKKLSALALALVLALSLCLTGCGGSDTLTLNVYNWGEYISDGSDGSLDTIHAFEDWYESTYGQKVKVNYSTYASNEDLYAKLKSGAVSYDVIIPSDYMIARLKDEGMLQPLNFDNIPNYQHIHEGFQGLYYDPDNQYSVPYTYGVVGIIYDANQVDPADAQGWDLMWNEKYAGKILQFNNSRDALGVALKYLGYSYNTTDPAQITAATDLLIQQKPLVQSYVMDEIFEKMQGNSAAIGAYYYGDYLTMADVNPDLAFCLPKEGTNLYVDAMCIPKGAENKANAEAFINFMCSTSVGLANVEETWYSSPLLSVREELDPEVSEDPYAYPDDAVLEQCESFRNLPEDILALYDSEWTRLKLAAN